MRCVYTADKVECGEKRARVRWQRWERAGASLTDTTPPVDRGGLDFFLPSQTSRDSSSFFYPLF